MTDTKPSLLEYGKLLPHPPRPPLVTDEAFRRRIGRQLNLGEATNDLRRFIFYANRGDVRYPHHDDQTTQALCHTLVFNACILSTTGHLQSGARCSLRTRRSFTTATEARRSGRGEHRPADAARGRRGCRCRG